MLEYSDLILVSNGKELFKAEIGAVSSVVATYMMLDELKALSVAIDNIVSYLSSDKFLTQYYTKSQLSSDFIAKTTMQNMLENQTYVLTSDAVTAANSLSTESQISAWRNDQFVANQKYIHGGYTYLKSAWGLSKGVNWKTEEPQQNRIKDFPKEDLKDDSVWAKDLNGY